MVSPERHGVPNHGQFDCLFNSLFRLTTKLRSKFYVIGPLWVESAGGFPSQRVSNALQRRDVIMNYAQGSRFIVFYGYCHWHHPYFIHVHLYPSGFHDDVIKWKHFQRYWPFVREIHRSPVNFPHKGQWRGALMFSLICVRMNGWVNSREAGDLGRYRVHYDVIVMLHQHWVMRFPGASGATLKHVVN